MRPGAGKQKGNAFERVVCRDLSLWLTKGSRADVFTRNITSGGQFTTRISSGDSEHGIPGDIMAHHPIAYKFLELFLVECKHHKDLSIDTYLYDARGTSSLAKIIGKCRKEAGQTSLHPMLVIKQNRYPALLVLMKEEAEAALGSVIRRMSLPYHALHSGSVFVFDFAHFRHVVSADSMIANMHVTKVI
jgi:hypothetical protein